MSDISLLRNAALPVWARRTASVLLVVGAGMAVVGAGTVAVGLVTGAEPAWLYLVCFVAVGPIALCCLVRAAATRVERLPWTLIGLALLLYSVANTLPGLAPKPAEAIPAWDYVMWLTWFPPFAVALVQLLRSRVHGVPRNLWLDSLVVGTAVTAVYTAVLVERYLREAIAAAGEIGIAVAYPLGDMVLLALVASVLVVYSWRLPRSWTWVVAPLVLATVWDGAQFAGLLPQWVGVGIWPLTALMFAWAAWLPAVRLQNVKLTGRRMVIAPVACSLTVLAVLLHGTVSGLGLAVALAAVSFLALVARVWLLFGDVGRAAIDLQAAHTEADRLSRTDPLTGAANRRAFGDAVDGARGAHKGTGILLVDIDFFKRVNDEYGHDAGDTVIVEVIRRMTGAVRRSDVVGRWGGEEFCVLLHGVPALAEVELVAEKVRVAVCQKPVTLPDARTIPVSVSVGAIFLAHVTTITAAMNAADQQLYAAKRGGRNQVCATVSAS